MERTLSSELFFEDKAAKNQASLPLRVIANLMLWQRRISSRHQLARLDSRLLADAGISGDDRGIVGAGDRDRLPPQQGARDVARRYGRVDVPTPRRP